MDKKSFRQRNGGKRPQNNRGTKNTVFFIVVVILFGLIIFAFRQPTNLKEISLTDAVRSANEGDYSKIMVSNNELQITKKNEDTPSLRTYIEPNSTLEESGFDVNKVQVNVKPVTSGSPWWYQVGSILLPILAVAAIFIFLMRGRPRARVIRQ